MNDASFVEKERERGRRKYRERGYKDNPTAFKLQKQMKFTWLRDAKRDFKVDLPTNVELHHWNYMDRNRVVVLDKRLHHRLHRIIKLNIDVGYYFYKDVPLDTLEKHLDIIRFVCDRDNFDFSKVNVLSK